MRFKFSHSERAQTSDTARLMAMLWAGFADAGIGCLNAKFSFSFWRPVTAIQAGGGNPALTADPNWLPLALPRATQSIQRRTVA